ncbi:MAG TPA: S8 family serine peptidase, partial [Armatimonadaceae bacterium]|nr:S8 family serine peptidase [Armatimonadaceae bacterium]
VPVSRLADIARTDGVAFVHRAEGLRFHPPTPATADSGPPARVAAPARARLRLAADAPAGDSRVLVGLIDVGGFDFAHPDFLDADGNTRFLRIWDQRGAFRPPPAGFAFGSEFTRERMNAALRAGRERGWSPHLIEPQADRVRGSHATHVASIAAGNRGVCPTADIVGVSVYLPREGDPDEERRRAFSDSSRITEAVEYLLGVAEAEGCPISINVSLGTNGGSHDGANATCRWLDHALASPGRTICIAGGNAGQESGETDDDTGWIFGRIHASGRIPARGLERVLEWVVVGNGVADFSENEMEIWLGPQDRFTVSVLPPGAAEWITVRPREFLLNHSLPNGTYLSVHNELYYAANGANYIAIYLSPRWDPASLSPVAAGTWRVRLTGEEVRDGRFHAWIERDDPVYRGPFGGAQAYSFPSFFAQATNVDTHSLNSLACSPRAVAVANLDEARQRIHRSSSQGPTRDDRNKPDIAAPGTEIVAAFGFPEEGDGEWVAMTGTSMASPYVAGVLARMLAVRPDLTAAQCLGILQRTARPLPSHAYDWRDDAGFGCIAPEEALREAATFHVRSELTL